MYIKLGPFPVFLFLFLFFQKGYLTQIHNFVPETMSPLPTVLIISIRFMIIPAKVGACLDDA